MRSLSKSMPSAAARAAVCVCLALAMHACTIIHYRPDVAIGTGRPGGVYLSLGDSICRLVNLDVAERGLRCAAYASRGPVANIESLSDQRVDIAVVQSDVLVDAMSGRGPFASRGRDTTLRVLFTGQTEAFTIVARRELEIAAAAELRGKRINLGSPGSGERVSMERVMGALGFAPTDFAAALELPLAQQHDAFCAKTLDAIVYTVRHPSGLVEDVVRVCDGVLVDIAGPQITALLSTHPEYSQLVVPANTYISNSRAVKTLGVRTVIVTTTRLPATVAYEITKALFDNIDDFRRLHPDFATLLPREMVPSGVVVPVHDGAARYYRERGWLP